VSPAASQRLRRGDRLRDRRDFQRVSRDAERANARSFVVLVAPSRRGVDADSRLGITASRRVGGAVVRNRVKRRVREWFRRHRGELSRGLDLVVIARPAASRLEQSAVAGELQHAVSRASGGARS
jgi:ribonuclease P protein component